jgi:hypothetical protein
MCLIFLKDIVAKGLSLGVENDRNITVTTALHKGSNHVDDTFHRAGRLTSTGNQRRQSMEGSVQIGGTVHKYEFIWIRYWQKPATPEFVSSP